MGIEKVSDTLHRERVSNNLFKGLLGLSMMEGSNPCMEYGQHQMKILCMRTRAGDVFASDTKNLVPYKI